MIVTSKVERIQPDIEFGYGVKITYTFTSFNEETINKIEEDLKQIDDVSMEVNTNEI